MNASHFGYLSEFSCCENFLCWSYPNFIKGQSEQKYLWDKSNLAEYPMFLTNFLGVFPKEETKDYLKKNVNKTKVICADLLDFILI